MSTQQAQPAQQAKPAQPAQPDARPPPQCGEDGWDHVGPKVHRFDAMNRHLGWFCRQCGHYERID